MKREDLLDQEKEVGKEQGINTITGGI